MAIHWFPCRLRLLADVVVGVAEHDSDDAVERTDLHHDQQDDVDADAVVDQIQSMAQYQSWMKTNVCNWGLEFDNCSVQHGRHCHEEEDAGQDRMVALHQSHHRH